MDPEMLRMMTDPEAMKDPARLRAFQRAQVQRLRTTVLGSLRTNALVMTVVGGSLLLVALAVGVAGVVAPGSLGPIPGGMPLLPALIGGVFVFLSRRTVPASPRIVRDGVRGTATVREVKSMDRHVGIERPGISATAGRVTCVLSVEASGLAPFVVEHREVILGSDVQHLKLGATIPVRVLPGATPRLAFDWAAVES